MHPLYRSRILKGHRLERIENIGGNTTIFVRGGECRGQGSCHCCCCRSSGGGAQKVVRENSTIRHDDGDDGNF